MTAVIIWGTDFKHKAEAKAKLEAERQRQAGIDAELFGDLPPVVQVQTVAHTDVGDAGHILQREVPSIYPITQNPPKQR